ncbi:hypothetical protein NDU88_003455 [Pleurodeles waltl]|uniref:Peptidase A2 domain-containing protein n=1 Tax=Pleurodeles waltl TaxID=8319 RepID=A0AAV7MUM6_PLEWA|nr:hypothetical protein NDU88_003455 [Pleurodeles waltl]
MDDDDEPGGTVYVIHATELGSQTGKKIPKCKVKVAGHQVTVLIDTGASINILAQSVFNQLQHPPPLRHTAVQVFAFGSTTPLPLAGVFMTDINHEEATVQAKVYVAKIGTRMLLSCRTAEEQKLVTSAFSIHLGTLDNLQEEYADLFRGIGCLKDCQVKLHIDKSIEPVALKHRRIAFHLRPQVEAELRKLEEADIIEKVEGPTPCVPPIVVTKKTKQPEEVRICVDMRLPNVAIRRERHLTPTVDDIVAEG